MKILRSQINLTCLLAIATLAATAFAVSPPPDGGYANETTAEGEDALFSLTNGYGNTALAGRPMDLATPASETRP